MKIIKKDKIKLPKKNKKFNSHIKDSELDEFNGSLKKYTDFNIKDLIKERKKQSKN